MIENRLGKMVWQAINGVRGRPVAPRNAPELAWTAGSLSVDRMNLSDAQLLPRGLRQVKNLLVAGDTQQRTRDIVAELLARGHLIEDRRLAPEPPRVSDVLELVRHAHDFGMINQVQDGLRWGVDLLRENPASGYVAEAKAGRGKGMSEGVVASPDGTVQDRASLYLAALKDANAIASLALATGNEAIAREALSAVRPHAKPQSDEITKRLKLLSQSLDETRNPQPKGGAKGEARRQSARRPLEFGVEREQARQQGVRIGYRQPLQERQALLQQIQRGEVPVVEGIQRLKERNPQHEEALNFMQICLKVAPEQRKNVKLDFVLEDDVPSRTDAASRLLNIFSEAGSPESAEVTALFLEMHPEFRGFETVRDQMLKKLDALRAENPNADFHARQLDSPTALLDWVQRSAVYHHDWINTLKTHEKSSDVSREVRIARGRARFEYAEYLSREAKSVRLSEKQGRVVSNVQDINQLLSTAERYIRKELSIGKDVRFSLGEPAVLKARQTAGNEGQARVAAALGDVIDSEKAALRVTRNLAAEISNLALMGKVDDAKNLLQVAQFMPEALDWDDVLSLLRIADAQGWHTERSELFACATALGQTPAHMQEMIWLGRLMGESAQNLPSEVDLTVGRRVLTEFLANTRKSEQDYLRVLKALGIQNQLEVKFWTQWRKELRLPGDQEPGYVIEQLLNYTQQTTQKGWYGAMLDVLSREKKGSQALKIGFDVLLDGVPPAHLGLVKAGPTAQFDVQRQILARLQDGVAASADSGTENHWLSTVMSGVNRPMHKAASATSTQLPAALDSTSSSIYGLPAVAASSPLQSVLAKHVSLMDAEHLHGLEEATRQFSAVLDWALGFRGGTREGLLSVLDKTVHYRGALDKTVHYRGMPATSTTDPNRRVERVAWGALAGEVQPAESSLILSAMHQGGVGDEKVRMELMKALKAGRFERASRPAALLAFVRAVPESVGKDSLRKGVLQELRAHYLELSDRRSLDLVNAALSLSYDEYFRLSDTYSFDHLDVALPSPLSNPKFDRNIADSVFKQLERQS